jgi:hypothetical protein
LQCAFSTTPEIYGLPLIAVQKGGGHVIRKSGHRFSLATSAKGACAEIMRKANKKINEPAKGAYGVLTRSSASIECLSRAAPKGGTFCFPEAGGCMREGARALAAFNRPLSN